MIPLLRGLRPSPPVGTSLLVMLTCVGLVSLELRQCWLDREARLNSAKTETSNLARSIATRVHDTFTIAETVFLGLGEHVRVDGTGPGAIARLERVMRMQISGQSLIRGLLLVNDHGDLLADSVPGTPHTLNYAGNDYFRYHRDASHDNVLIGRPVFSKVDGSSVVPVTQRLAHADGSFAGLLNATIATKTFRNEFRNFDVGNDGAITLIGAGHIILVRQPFAEENVGGEVSDSQLLHEFADGSEAKNFEYVSLIDGLTKLGSFRRVPGFDLTLVVSRDQNEVLAGWWRDMQVHLTWMALALSALGVLAWRKPRWMRTTAETEMLYRLLANDSAG